MTLSETYEKLVGRRKEIEKPKRLAEAHAFAKFAADPEFRKLLNRIQDDVMTLGTEDIKPGMEQILLGERRYANRLYKYLKTREEEASRLLNKQQD